MDNDLIQLLIDFLIAGICIRYIIYSGNKVKEYGEDERWKIIREKAGNVSRYYYYFALDFFLVMSLVFTILKRFYPNLKTINIDLYSVIMIIIIVLSIGFLVDLFALKYFDKKM